MQRHLKIVTESSFSFIFELICMLNICNVFFKHKLVSCALFKICKHLFFFHFDQFVHFQISLYECK